MQKLIIAEKPSVAQSIAKVLGVTERKDGYIIGADYIVSWCVGHLVGLSSPEIYDEQYKKWSFDTLPIIPEKWKFSLNAATKKQFDILKELMSRDTVDELVCATDAGREGECIFRYVYHKTGCKKPFKRLWVSSLEETAIRDGFNNLKNGHDYDKLYEAGLCRAKADWLVGMNGTRLFSIRYNTALNIGRVQTPTLAMIVHRDYEVKNFVKQKYFTSLINCGQFTATTERIDDENIAKSITEKCNGKNAVVTSVKKETKTINPPKLYDLTTLQREANRQFGYTAQQTLNFTQSLYEKKLCTYPRTDSQFITEDMETTALTMIDAVCKYIPCCNKIKITSPDVKRIINNKKVSDHHALMPTSNIETADFNSLSDGERNILYLISAKLVCAVAEAHKYETVKVILNCENTDFSAIGKTVQNDGWKKAETCIKSLLKGIEEKKDNSDENEKALPEIKEGQTFENIKSSVAEHWTSPPKFYTEDTLLKAMETAGNKDYDDDADVEKKGLGTPATRAGIIEGLVKHGYVERNKKQLSATSKGVNLISVVPDEVKSAKMTAEWEEELQNIEKGNLNSSVFMDNIENYVKEICGKYSSVVTNSVFTPARNVIGVCPICDKNVIETKMAYSCESGKDGCGFAIWKMINEAKISEVQAKKLLETKKTDIIKGFVSKSGKKFDHYLILNEDNKIAFAPFDNAEKKIIGTCPKCGKQVVETFKAYSCENSKDNCGFVIWKTIAGKAISETQVKKLLAKKKTDLISGFKSKTGNKFDAYLVIKDDFTTGFEFPPKNK